MQGFLEVCTCRRFSRVGRDIDSETRVEIEACRTLRRQESCTSATNALLVDILDSQLLASHPAYWYEATPVKVSY